MVFHHLMMSQHLTEYDEISSLVHLLMSLSWSQRVLPLSIHFAGVMAKSYTGWPGNQSMNIPGQRSQHGDFGIMPWRIWPYPPALEPWRDILISLILTLSAFYRLRHCRPGHIECVRVGVLLKTAASQHQSHLPKKRHLIPLHLWHGWNKYEQVLLNWL